MKGNYTAQRGLRMRETKKKGRWLGWTILILIIAGLLYVGYTTQYKPRIEIKNYASLARITLVGIELKILEFKTADETRRQEIIRSLPPLCNKFYEIECPNDNRTIEIQWKMAKIFDHTWTFMKSKEDAELQEIEERIANIKWLVDDAIQYGNFKQL